MKSLEILKEGVDFMNRAIKVNPNSVKELQSEIDRYIEAINELEELNSRSCDSCKYSFDIFTGVDDNLLGEDFICTKLEVDKVFEKDFCCSRYEAKGE